MRWNTTCCSCVNLYQMFVAVWTSIMSKDAAVIMILFTKFIFVLIKWPYCFKLNLDQNLYIEQCSFNMLLLVIVCILDISALVVVTSGMYIASLAAIVCFYVFYTKVWILNFAFRCVLCLVFYFMWQLKFNSFSNKTIKSCNIDYSICPTVLPSFSEILIGLIFSLFNFTVVRWLQKQQGIHQCQPLSLCCCFNFGCHS